MEQVDAHISGYIDDSIGPGPMPLSIYLTSPYDGQIFNIGDSIIISTAAFDSISTIKSVSFYRDSTTLLGKVTKPPYVWKISKATAGNLPFLGKSH